MKNTGTKRFFSAVLAVVLAVGLMPLPAFAETSSAQQKDTPLAEAGSTALASGQVMTTQAYYSDEKEITGLGTKGISNPKFANGGWNKVYFGSEGEPLLFNVLNTHETCFGGDTMFLDCSKVLVNMSPGNNRNEFFHSGCNTNKYLNGEFLQQRFTSAEQGAIAYSVKGGEAPSDGVGWRGSSGDWVSPFCRIDWRDFARIFILDAHEATNESYGFTNPGKTKKYYSDSFTRSKTGADTHWWTRSQYRVFNSHSYVTIRDNGQFSYFHRDQTAGVSPCLNVKLSSILYTSRVDTNTYKLTVKDDNIKASVGDASDNLTWVTAPYTITGNYSQLNILLTDAEWTDSGWSNTDADFIYMKANESIKHWDEHSTTGNCAFNSRLLVDHPGYNVYLIAEMQNGDHETDSASAPVKLTVKKNIGRIASGYTGTYDGKAHGISVDVTWPGSGATVKYGTTEGVYDLDTSPTIANVADSPLRVYYQITADGFFTTTFYETVTILPANPTIPTGVTAYYGEPLGNASLPDGWSWDDGNAGVGGLGVKSFSASYKSTNPNYKSIQNVTIPVTVVEREHHWGTPFYEWNADNSQVTAKHMCFLCLNEQTETVSTSREITKQPTCTAKGESTYTATFSTAADFQTQMKTVEDIPVDHSAHNWGAWTKTKPATCEGVGKEERVCQNNPNHKESREVAALGHNWQVKYEYVEDHDYITGERKCVRCDKTYTWQEPFGGGHVHDPVNVAGVAETCDTAGTVEHCLCQTCGRRFTDMTYKTELSESDVNIAPTGHAWSEWTKTKSPTCSEGGVSERVCENNPSHKETRTDGIDLYAHDWGEWKQTKKPTCTSAGEDTRVCKHDPSHTEKRVGALGGHDWGNATYEWAPDGSHVVATRTCKVNASHTEIETASVTSEVTKEPTCAAKGETTHTATFENEGFTTQSKSFEDVAIDPDAHDWGGWVLIKPSSCTKKGVEERVCSHDSSHKETRDVAVDSKAHSWGEWTVIKPATETEEGVEQRVCENDASHIETRAIPKLDPAKPDTPAKTSIAKAKVTLKKTSCAYDGNAKKPGVKSVVLNGKALKAGTDYTVKYANNKKLGTATVTVTGRGNYKDSAKATFKIVLGKARASTVGSVGKKYVKVSWKKVKGAKKYQLQCKQVGGKWKTATVKGTSKVVKGLKAGKLYQFRVRAVAGKRAGAWSNVPKRYLQAVKGVSATIKKPGAVTAAWKADPKAKAGYTVFVRYKKGGAVAAKVSVAAGKTKATVKGLKAGKRYWVQVRPMRSSGGKTYTGVLRGTWAKAKAAKSVKSQSVQGGSGLMAAGI